MRSTSNGSRYHLTLSSVRTAKRRGLQPRHQVAIRKESTRQRPNLAHPLRRPQHPPPHRRRTTMATLKSLPRKLRNRRVEHARATAHGNPHKALVSRQLTVAPQPHQSRSASHPREPRVMRKSTMKKKRENQWPQDLLPRLRPEQTVSPKRFESFQFSARPDFCCHGCRLGVL